MTVTAIESYTPVTAATETTPGAGVNLGKDDFLMLLVTQMKNQDPLDPMDGTEYTAQLAQFSSLEALQNIETELQKMKIEQAAAGNSRAADYLGKTVTAAGNSFELTNGAISDFSFRIDADAATTNVMVYDRAGNFVANIDTGARTAGEYTITWDGTDRNGTIASDGTYFAEVLAIDGSGYNLNAETRFSGRAEEINFKGGTAYLQVGGREVTLDDIRKINN